LADSSRREHSSSAFHKPRAMCERDPIRRNRITLKAPCFAMIFIAKPGSTFGIMLSRHFGHDAHSQGTVSLIDFSCE